MRKFHATYTLPQSGRTITGTVKRLDHTLVFTPDEAPHKHAWVAFDDPALLLAGDVELVKATRQSSADMISDILGYN